MRLNEMTAQERLVRELNEGLGSWAECHVKKYGEMASGRVKRIYIENGELVFDVAYENKRPVEHRHLSLRDLNDYTVENSSYPSTAIRQRRE